MAENTNPFNYRNIARAFMPKANPNGLTPDGTTVARVRRRDQGSNDFMGQIVELFGRLLGQQRPNQTPENLRAIRNNPADEYNKASQDPSNPRFMQGNNRSVAGVGMVGPNTAAMLESGQMTPEQLARMQGRTAMNQWKFPEMFRQQDAERVAGVVRDHNEGVNFIKDQQSQMLPTVDFRQRDPNLSGQYQGTNVRDFLVDQSKRQAQSAADMFDAPPADAIKMVIPKASHGGIPGYATQAPPQMNEPVRLPGFRFDSGGLPAVNLPSPSLNISSLFGNDFKPDKPTEAPTVMPKTDWDAIAAAVPAADSVGFAYGPNGLSYPDSEGKTYDQDGYLVKNGQKYDRRGNPVYGPSKERIGRSLRSLFN